jgi:hypothetical protein
MLVRMLSLFTLTVSTRVAELTCGWLEVKALAEREPRLMEEAGERTRERDRFSFEMCRLLKSYDYMADTLRLVEKYKPSRAYCCQM